MSEGTTTTTTTTPLLKPRHEFRDRGDIGDINGCRDFWTQFRVESSKLWRIAGPIMLTSVCRYSLGAVTQIYAGHVSTLVLAAFSVENSVIAGFSFGIMLGMGSALETLCGQAYGAGQLEMMGVYMQRSWIILMTTALILTPLYIFAGPLLLLIGQDPTIASAAGKFALLMIPQLYAYSIYFPLTKFLQAQSRVFVMLLIAAGVLLLHTVLSWFVSLKLGWGAPGLAFVLNLSWWCIVVIQYLYILMGSCGAAWSGFSLLAFRNIWSFAKLSIASAIMLCLETWYFMALILFAGYLKNPELSVDALSICMNILGWAVMIAIGSNAATSVRVSNELGAGHPKTAKFAVVCVVITSFFIGLFLSVVLLISRNEYPVIFTNDADVKELVSSLTPLLAISITINNVQPVLTGLAIGAGWQVYVAYVNITCYYAVGVPIGLILGYLLDFGVTGIWLGMLSGTVMQTCVLFLMTYKTNWNKEASMAEDRIKTWGGKNDTNAEGKSNAVIA